MKLARDFSLKKLLPPGVLLIPIGMMLVYTSPDNPLIITGFNILLSLFFALIIKPLFNRKISLVVFTGILLTMMLRAIDMLDLINGTLVIGFLIGIFVLLN